MRAGSGASSCSGRKRRGRPTISCSCSPAWRATRPRALADENTAVVGVDLPSYLHGLASSDDGCHYVIAEIEDLSHQLERELGFAGYRSPVLAGVGAGGPLAYAALAQSPAATIGGAGDCARAA